MQALFFFICFFWLGVTSANIDSLLQGHSWECVEPHVVLASKLGPPYVRNKPFLI